MNRKALVIFGLTRLVQSRNRRRRSPCIATPGGALVGGSVFGRARGIAYARCPENDLSRPAGLPGAMPLYHCPAKDCKQKTDNQTKTQSKH
ncbi:hypothetical protein LMG28614_06055 [Paraburkholderia ultramafica]|uniref:Uncharacterized protein n=1 Tax=Paraburkholderia ultramafica TaxID=1544867 RepID=A0A6S7BLF3_9BURK|nr:hypothetical protein LMG28614_06055 [Paraburkholderia ultramafica]